MTIETPIEGLKININKVVKDNRGYLCELAPQGLTGPFFKAGVKNVHTSVAVGRGTVRGGHYHHRNTENFYTLAGTALWIFHDYRATSPTAGKTWGVMLGTEDTGISDMDSHLIAKGEMAQVVVPAGIYHAFCPVTDQTVIVLVMASEQHDNSDYVRPAISEVPGAWDILSKAGINV
jgi:dTDP-4-dehydrorhamnose 3,5-epimerase-like enzyme